ncbi:hypothetical protein [Streptomyces sp. MK37H]|uniref:hypothetical protein n=1 Tax=Streptomyces sp. MK37H TaxID=2699117 RepID=UPI001B37860E|nr:hypothetical protein [Streptomyces sp. MK37H]MBP8535166.1 hypothetical protein [Streptomyces sp. MK37H]
MPGPTGDTVAVTVTGSLTVEGFGEETTDVVVAALPTVWVSVPLDVAKFSVPL